MPAPGAGGGTRAGGPRDRPAPAPPPRAAALGPPTDRTRTSDRPRPPGRTGRGSSSAPAYGPRSVRSAWFKPSRLVVAAPFPPAAALSRTNPIKGAGGCLVDGPTRPQKAESREGNPTKSKDRHSVGVFLRKIG